MSQADPRIEAFFAEAKRWRGELQTLREILHTCPVAETFKWRSPVYTAHGGNIAALWSMKEACTLSFFKGVLLKDSKGILAAPGENSRSMRLVRFTGIAEIAASKAALKDCILEAVENEKAGLKVTFPKDDRTYPGELVDRLDADPDFQAAFEALTPGRRRGYILHFAQAKQSKTRSARIEKHAPRILAGKGLQDR